jgi:hypothetical protein
MRAVDSALFFLEFISWVKNPIIVFQKDNLRVPPALKSDSGHVNKSAMQLIGVVHS